MATTGRILISRNPADLLTLASKVYAKHVEAGKDSPLNVMADTKWEVVGPTINTAQAKHDEAEAYKGQMEAAYRERDLLLPAIDDALKNSRDLLKAVNAKNPKRMADWGFEIDDTPQDPKAPKP